MRKDLRTIMATPRRHPSPRPLPTRRSRFRPVAAALGLVLALGGLVVVDAPAAGASEVYPRPVTGVLRFDGHGYGHGHGLSQWGAYGAAIKGLGWQQILGFYYPGTRLVADLADAPIRVQLRVDEGQDTWVDPAAGLTFTDAQTSLTLNPTTVITGWRLVPAPTVPGALQLQYFTATKQWTGWDPVKQHDDAASNVGSWGEFAVPGTSASTPVDSLPRLVLPGSTRRAIRGAIRGVADGGGVQSVAVLPMEQYLRSVVPSEMPTSFGPNALAAQAVAARTYAGQDRWTNRTSAWDTCDTTACQVFKGSKDYLADGTTLTHEGAAGDAAVAATASWVVRYGTATDGSSLAFTQFSASDGGWTVAGSKPYLVAQPDPYDGVPTSTSNPHSWSSSIAVSTVEAAFPSIGRLVDLAVLQRDGNGEWGGRVLSVRLDGSNASVTVSGTDFQRALGLRSTWWTVVLPPDPNPLLDRTSDAVPDLVAREAATGNLFLYPGSGTGGLGARSQIGPGWNGMDAVLPASDFDGDGRADLLARQAGTGQLWLYPGNGRGGYLDRRQVGTGWQTMSAILGAGDFDGDGHADVLARAASTGVLWLYPGDGHGGWLAPRQVGTRWNGMSALIAAGDFDGDGHVDVLARAASTGALWLYPGDGQGGWLTPRQVGTGWSGMRLLLGIGDLDRDGNRDLLAVDPSQALWLYRGDGHGGWLPRRQIGNGWGGMDLLS